MRFFPDYQINGCPADTADFLDGIWTSLGLHGDEALSEKGTGFLFVEF